MYWSLLVLLTEANDNRPAERSSCDIAPKLDKFTLHDGQTYTYYNMRSNEKAIINI